MRGPSVVWKARSLCQWPHRNVLRYVRSVCLSVMYFATLSVAGTAGWYVNNQFERIWTEAVNGRVHIPTQPLSGGISFTIADVVAEIRTKQLFIVCCSGKKQKSTEQRGNQTNVCSMLVRDWVRHVCCWQCWRKYRHCDKWHLFPASWMRSRLIEEVAAWRHRRGGGGISHSAWN